MHLNQVGSRRNVGASYLDTNTEPVTELVGPLSLDMGQGDLGQGDLGQGDLGQGDLGQGDLGQGDLGQGDLGQGDLGQGDLGTDVGSGDLGRGDLGSGDLPLDPNTNERSTGDIDFETATALGNGVRPTSLPPGSGMACGWIGSRPTSVGSSSGT